MQTDLFDNSKQTNQEISLERAKTIEGLEIHTDFINRATESNLIQEINDSKWMHDLSRRVQHYGFKYDYKARRIDSSAFLGKLPTWINKIALDIYEKQIIDFIPDQAIINEYQCGQGIAPHIDCEPCFGDTIISLSLGSSCIMNFEQEPNSKRKTEIFIEPRTLLVMKGPSRYNWYHGISPRKSDKFNSESIKRNTRLSITFRKVLLNQFS